MVPSYQACFQGLTPIESRVFLGFMLYGGLEAALKSAEYGEIRPGPGERP